MNEQGKKKTLISQNECFRFLGRILKSCKQSIELKKATEDCKNGRFGAFRGCYGMRRGIEREPSSPLFGTGMRERWYYLICLFVAKRVRIRKCELESCWVRTWRISGHT